jgi:hypothetical protein
MALQRPEMQTQRSFIAATRVRGEAGEAGGAILFSCERTRPHLVAAAVASSSSQQQWTCM